MQILTTPTVVQKMTTTGCFMVLGISFSGIARIKKEKRNILYHTLLPPKGKSFRTINKSYYNTISPKLLWGAPFYCMAPI
jgi:hypothetical protein